MTRDCVAGLDPSLTGFGVAIWSETSDKPDELHRFSSKPGPKDMQGRIDRIAGLLRSVFDLFDVWEPRIVVVEHYAYQAINSDDSHGVQQGHYDRVELGGILRADLCTTDYIQQAYEVNPATLKAFVMKGNAKKPELMNRIYVDWGLLCESTDEADAAACAKMARCVAGFDKPDSDRQETALARMLGVENWTAWWNQRAEIEQVEYL